MTTRYRCPGQLAMFDVLGPMAVRIHGRVYFATAPITLALSQRQKTLKEELGPFTRNYLRAKKSGWIGTVLADRICMRGLKSHPAVIYGVETWGADLEEAA